MKKLGIIAACLVALVGGVVGWYKFSYPDYVHRYRLTIAIEVDGKVHSGSSVIEVIYLGQPYVPGSGSFIPHVRGQAPLIDLGARGAVIAALHPGTIQNGSSNTNNLAMRAYKITGGYDSYRIISEQAGPRELTPENMPLLIWFSNVGDPKTARVFKVGEISSLFGPTARLVAAFVEITSDPVVIDIDKTIPWYNELVISQKGHGFTTYPNQLTLVYNMFVGEAS